MTIDRQPHVDEPVPAGLLGAEKFVSGRICLDLVNTLCSRKGEDVDAFASFVDLDRWVRSAEYHFGIDLGWRSRPDHRDAMLREAVRLRALAGELVRGTIAKGVPQEADLRKLNALLRSLPVSYQVMGDAASPELARHALQKADEWSTAITLDLADLICNGDVSLLRECESATCVRVFHDTTKNHKRRWCSAETCGSQAKAAAYYRRKTGKAPPLPQP